MKLHEGVSHLLRTQRQPMKILELQKEIHQNAVDKGFYEDLSPHVPTDVTARAALVHSEISEALEDVRKANMTRTILASGKPVGFPSEIADTAIRIMDHAEFLGIDLERQYVRDNRADETVEHTELRTAVDYSCGLGQMHEALVMGDLMCVLDWCYTMAFNAGFDLYDAVVEKHEYNLTRERKHGDKVL